MRKLALLLALLPTFAFGADVTSTTGWTSKIDSGDMTAVTVTVDSGSNRNFVIYHTQQNNTDPGGTASCDSVNPTETIVYNQSMTGDPDHWHYLYRWDETDIASFADSTPDCTVDNAAGAFTQGFLYGTVEDSQQSDWSGTDVFTGTDSDEGGADLVVTTTSDSGDLVLCAAHEDGVTLDITWSDATEIVEGEGGDNWTTAYASRNGGTDTETISDSAADAFSGSCMTIVNAASGPSFSSGPTVAAAADGFTISGTITGENATVYAVACLPSASDATTAEVIISDCASAVTPEFSGSEAWTADAADSFTITGTNPAVEYKICIAGDGATGDTTVTCVTDQRSADASQSIHEPTSYAATSPFTPQSENTCDTTTSSATVTGCADTSWVVVGMLVDVSGGFADTTDLLVTAKTSTTITLCPDWATAGCVATANSTTSNITITEDTYYSPAVAVGDVIEMDDANSITGTMSVESDGDVTCSTTCSGYFEVDYCIQDVSSTSGIGFTTPACWTTDATMYFNSTAPAWTDSLQPLILIKDAAMTSVDYSATCEDTDSQTLTFEDPDSALPAGLSLSGAGVLSGTPTAVFNSVIRISCKDSGGLHSVQSQSIRVIDGIPPRKFRRSKLRKLH